MIKIKPFQAILYNNKKFKDFSKLVCPPYDIISSSQQAEYYRNSKHNMIRLILGKKNAHDDENNNRYKRSAKLFHKWIDNGVLVRDGFESVYIYEQDYKYQNKVKTRLGFICLLKIQGNMIHPHEHTHLEPKEDRLQLMKQVKANLSPIFVLFSDKRNIILDMKNSCKEKSPRIAITDKFGIKNKLWRIDDVSWINKLSDYMTDKEIFIADGHHRFEVASTYRDMLRCTLPDFSNEAPYNYIMAYFTDMDSSDLTIMATHRLLKDIDKEIYGNILERLGEYFEVESLKGKKDLVCALDRYSKKPATFGMYFRDRFYVLLFKKGLPQSGLKRLDVSLFNRFILNETLGLGVEDKNIIYSSDINESIMLVNKKKAKLAFLLNATKIDELKNIVLNNQKMPPKSTYFYPKLLSGLTIHKF